MVGVLIIEPVTSEVIVAVILGVGVIDGVDEPTVDVVDDVVAVVGAVCTCIVMHCNGMVWYG